MSINIGLISSEAEAKTTLTAERKLLAA